MAHEGLDAIVDVDGRLKGFGACEIVDLEFYDGPLSGVILFADARPVRLRTIATSYGRGLRAFELSPLPLGWEASAKALAEFVEQHRCSPSSEAEAMSEAAFDRVVQALATVPVECRYVAVGDSWLTRLLVVPASEAEVASLHAIDESAAFRAAHRLVKQYRRSRSGV